MTVENHQFLIADISLNGCVSIVNVSFRGGFLWDFSGKVNSLKFEEAAHVLGEMPARFD